MHGRTRTPPLRGVAALGALVLLASCTPTPSPRPNVVLVLVDALRADRLGSYGWPADSSPELDGLARGGVRFDRVLAQSSWTRPSMASMLTSLYPRTLAIRSEREHALGERFTTLAEVLRDAGYATLGATANPNANGVFQFDQGFDTYLDSTVVWAWMPGAEGRLVYRDHPLQDARQVFDAVLERLPAESDRPHYVQVNVMDVHQAFETAGGRAEATRLHPDDPDRPYVLALQRASSAIGDFLRALRARPGWGRTLVVVTSDHGEGLSDHPDVTRSRGHGYLLYGSQLWVPLILSDPGGALPAGRVVHRTVRLLDLMPTILDYAGVEGPPGMQGVSLLPLLDDPDADVGLPERFAVETEFRWARKLGIYAGPWEYIENRDHHRGAPARELQPAGAAENGARTDAAGHHPEVVQRLQRELAEWERAFPPGEPTDIGDALSKDEEDQLRALGYLE